MGNVILPVMAFEKCAQLFNVSENGLDFNTILLIFSVFLLLGKEADN